MTYNKIGFLAGVGGNPNGIGDYVRQLDANGIPAVIMCNDGSTGLSDVFALETAVEHVMAFRVVVGEGGKPREYYAVPNYDAGPVTAGIMHWDLIRPFIPKEVEENRDRVWIFPTNEIRAWPDVEGGQTHTPEEWGDWLGRMGVALATRANQEGFKVSMFGFSSGEPEPLIWRTDGMQEYFEYCAGRPNMAGICLHEYSYEVDNIRALYDEEADRGYRIGRFVDLVNACRELGLPTPPVLMGEFGWTLKDIPQSNRAMEDIKWAAELYAQYPEVLGAGIWYLGPYLGIADKAQPLIRPVTDFSLTAVFDPPLPPPPIDPPPTAEKHTAIVVKLPQDMTQAEWVKMSTLAYPFRHTVTASHDDMLTVLQGGNDDSYVKFTHPERDAESVALVEFFGYAWELFGEEEEPPPVPPPQGDWLAVEKISQRDPQWANHVLGQNTGHSKTIGNWGCLLVVYNALARYWGISDYNPAAENDYFVDQGAFVDQYIVPGALQIAYPNAVSYDGFQTRENHTMRPKIREWIDKGRPVPARVDFNPATPQWEQHWVLIVGYEGDSEFYMMDPWHGDIVTVNSRYGIAGSDILEALFYRPLADVPAPPPPPPAGPTYDLVAYMFPETARVYEVRHPDGSQERIQTQLAETPGVAYIVKGENQGFWELWSWDSTYIYLVRDTSPGPDGVFYDVRKADGQVTPWCKRYMKPGESFADSGHVVTFKSKTNCQPVDDARSGNATNHTTFVDHFDRYVFDTGIQLDDCVMIKGNTEEHVFAKGYGRVAWYAPWGDSEVSEIHQPGARPDIRRETGCFGG
jgi:hypothetical protein